MYLKARLCVFLQPQSFSWVMNRVRKSWILLGLEFWELGTGRSEKSER